MWLDHLITHPLRDRDPDLVRLGFHQRLPAQEEPLRQIDIINWHHCTPALVPALGLTGVAGDASMNIKKRQAALIEHIQCLNPDFHETRRGQADVPAVIRQLGRLR
ncbi:hypothetical protein D3C71_1860120 [compost metagenome]